MIVLAVIGILAAIVVPQFQSHSSQAKEAAAKKNLRTLRSAIELYAARHNGVPPGYPDNDPTKEPGSAVLYFHLVKTEAFMIDLPENPFNGNKQVNVLANGAAFPDEPTGTFGWVYKPLVARIRLDWPGTDAQGLRYYDY
jgi:type II secretory pathway pseudopilin PulG